MLPYKIVQDLNPAAAPENSSTLNVNVNFDILKQALINEQGFDKLSTTGKEIIGSTILPNNSICVFSVINDGGIIYSEIGIITDTTYKIIVRDRASNASLGFTTEHQIQAQSKVNFNGDYIVYWVDGFNPDRWLNITNPQIDIVFIDFYGEFIPSISNAEQISLMFGFTPVRGEYIDSTATTISGGSLTAAVYYIVCTYGDKYKNFTQTLYVSSPIPVTDSNTPFDVNYIGSEAGVVTNKAISISINASRLNTEYDYIRVQVIRKQNQVVTAWLFGDFSFGTANFTCIIDRLTNEVAVDSVLINLANYKSSLTVTQLDDVLYKANLKSRIEFDFQPYVNNTIINYIQKPINLAITTAGNSYKDPNMCFYSKGFMYDEVYAFYQSFVIEENGEEYETTAYHIPGRFRAQPLNLGPQNPSVQENALLSSLNPEFSPTQYMGNVNSPVEQMLSVSPLSKVFHAINTADRVGSGTASNMAYWENENETYPNLDRWKVKNADGTVIPGLINANRKVRHHKFPEAYNATDSNKSIHPSNGNYNVVNILGVELANVVIPDEYAGKVKKVKLYYAKRDYNNKTILGQSLLSTLNGLHNPSSNDSSVRGNIFNSVGNMLFTDMPSAGSGNPHNTGLYPLTYELEDGIGPAAFPKSLEYTYSAFSTEGPANPWNGYMKMKPFDMMQQSLTVNTATHIKNLYRVASKYDGQRLEPPNTDLSTSAGSYNIGFIFDPVRDHTLINAELPTYFGINRQISGGFLLYNQYRKIKSAEYVDLNTPPDPLGASMNSPYTFEMKPYNYLGEKAIWLETETRLLPAFNNNYTAITGNTLGFTFQAINTFKPFDTVVLSDDTNGYKFVMVQTANATSFSIYAGSIPGTGPNPKVTSVNSSYNNDIAKITFLSNNDFDTSFRQVDGRGEPAYSSPYISNICAFKLNVFEGFDNQILCSAGEVDVFPSGNYFYNGDTFTSVYGERETMNLTAWTPNFVGAEGSPQSFISGIHNYICQSTSNINYRYEGNNTWETFFPTTDFNTMSRLPFTNPEWYGYNPDYSAVNDLLQPVIGPIGITQFQNNFPNRVIRSANDNPEIMNDNYLIYEAGNYRDVGKAKGPIENIANQNSKLLIKARKALFYTLGREIINTENSESYVGAGDIFAVKPKESVSSDSYGGGIGRFSDVITQYGYMYADATNGIVYVAAPSQGDSINEISNEGLQIFFRTELKFKLPEQLYNKYYSLLPAYSGASVSYLNDFYVTFNGEIWKSNASFISSPSTFPGQSDLWDKVDFYTLTDNTTDIQGIGVHATFDYKYRRYILAKKDYNFVDFPTEWLPNLNTAPPNPLPSPDWGKIVYYGGIIYRLASDNPSSIYFEPDGVYLPRNNYGVKVNFAEYFEDKSFTIAYYPESKAWVSMYDYYPNFLFNTIDKVYSTKNTQVFKHNSNTQNNFYYDDTIIESFIEPILNSPGGVKKFSSISFYTDVFVKTITTKALEYLNTFTNYFVRNTWQMSKNTVIDNTTTSRNAERVFNTNAFRDFTRDNNEPLMDSKYIPQQNVSNLNLTKHWSLQKKFVDYFLIPRFKFKQEWVSVTGTLITSDDFTNIMTSTTRAFNIGDAIKFDFIPPATIIITKVLSDTTYEFETRDGVVEGFNATEFEYLPSKEIHIYDINSQSTKNIR